jgi:NAD(P)-dependent dehydrogenase (short-subunit alcohol dehydrogenase family)
MASKERNALILGASRGLGLRLVQQYLARDWAVVGTVRGNRPPALDRKNPKLEVEQLDVTKPSEIAALRDKLKDRRFDLLFANAGTTHENAMPIGQVAAEDFIRVMLTNAFGPMQCVDAFASLVTDQGTIAVMSSGLGSIAGNESGGWETYRASKAALDMMLRSFAVRRPKRGQTVLAIAPGWSRTDMGGSSAPLDPDDSVKGVIKTLDSFEGSGKHAFVDYQGGRVPW